MIFDNFLSSSKEGYVGKDLNIHIQAQLSLCFFLVHYVLLSL